MVIREGWIVALLAGGLALLVNQVSPRGLSLTRDYFPVVAAPGGSSVAAVTPTNTAAIPSENPVEMRLRARGLTAVRMDEVVSWHADPRYAAGLFLFIDAREDRAYEAGHIPGALPFDHYHPEQRMAEAMSAAQAAEKIVVYCNGGECEDSEFTAVMLQQAGVPLDRLLIFTGGITEWKQARRPVEIGARFSGVLKEGSP